MGFYSPATLIRDAIKHGVDVAQCRSGKEMIGIALLK